MTENTLIFAMNPVFSGMNQPPTYAEFTARENQHRIRISINQSRLAPHASAISRERMRQVHVMGAMRLALLPACIVIAIFGHWAVGICIAMLMWPILSSTISRTVGQAAIAEARANPQFYEGLVLSGAMQVTIR